MLSPPMSSHLRPNGSEWPHNANRQKQWPLFLTFLHLLLQLFPSLSSHILLCSLLFLLSFPLLSSPSTYPSSLPPSFLSPPPPSLFLPSFLSYEEFLKETNELNKLEDLLQNQVTTSQFFVSLMAFLNALTVTKDFTENPEFNKRCSQLVATLK